MALDGKVHAAYRIGIDVYRHAEAADLCHAPCAKFLSSSWAQLCGRLVHLCLPFRTKGAQIAQVVVDTPRSLHGIPEPPGLAHSHGGLLFAASYSLWKRRLGPRR
jgi:hypothetical protein